MPNPPAHQALFRLMSAPCQQRSSGGRFAARITGRLSKWLTAS
jgi:hypothetical protein